MSPRTRQKLTGAEFVARQSRKRKGSELEEAEFNALLDKIDGINAVCHSTFQIVDELKIVVQNLLVENTNIKAELGKLKALYSAAASSSTHVPTAQSGASYASALKSKPVVIVRPKDAHQDSSITKQALRESVVPSNNTVCGIRNAAHGGIVIECDNLAGSSIIHKDISAQIGENYVVSVPTKRPTKIRIVGMSEQLPVDDLTKKILAQNHECFEEKSSIEVVSTFKIGNSFGAKLVLDSESFNKIMVNSKLRIGWDVCRVYEAFDLVRCFNCCDYHHVAKNCTSSKRCPKCAGEHTLQDCTSQTECCCNCTAAMASMKLTIDTKHSALSSDCPVYLRKIRAEQRRTNYKN